MSCKNIILSAVASCLKQTETIRTVFPLRTLITQSGRRVRCGYAVRRGYTNAWGPEKAFFKGFAPIREVGIPASCIAMLMV